LPLPKTLLRYYIVILTFEQNPLCRFGTYQIISLEWWVAVYSVDPVHWKHIWRLTPRTCSPGSLTRA
jgi:hypothetical protein